MFGAVLLTIRIPSAFIVVGWWSGSFNFFLPYHFILILHSFMHTGKKNPFAIMSIRFFFLLLFRPVNVIVFFFRSVPKTIPLTRGTRACARLRSFD